MLKIVSNLEARFVEFAKNQLIVHLITIRSQKKKKKKK